MGSGFLNGCRAESFNGTNSLILSGRPEPGRIRPSAAVALVGLRVIGQRMRVLVGHDVFRIQIRLLVPGFKSLDILVKSLFACWTYVSFSDSSDLIDSMSFSLTC